MGTGIMVGGAIRYYNRRQLKSFIVNGNSSGEIKDVVSQVFDDKLYLHKLLVTGVLRQPKGPLSESVADSFKEHQIFLHPLRLSVMKLVYDNYRITSIDLREMLQISWSNLSNALKKFEEAGYILTKDEFHDSNVKQTIYITSEGKTNFETFTALIDQFLQISESFDEMYPNN